MGVVVAWAWSAAGPATAQGGGGPFPVRDGGKFGYMNTTGKTVIPVQFDDAGDFVGGLAPINVGGKIETVQPAMGGKWGYIDKTGRLVIEAIFEVPPRPFDQAGLALAMTKAGEWGYIDRKGAFVRKPTK
jgi:hypothetical protein